MKHIHLISGGAGSWLAAKLDMAAYPDVEHIFSFTDTLYEDADCYRFLLEGVAHLLGRPATWVPPASAFPDYRVAEDVPIESYCGNPDWRKFLAALRAAAERHLPELVWLVDGRDVWEVFRDERMLGNSSMDPCSRVLKRQLRDRWIRDNFAPADVVLTIGIGPEERHRFDDGDGHGFGPRMAAAGWTVTAPLIGTLQGEIGARPYVLRSGLQLPRLYGLGYDHNNCGGMCCKAGQGHWKHRHDVQRERFEYDAMMERKIIAFLGGAYSMLSDRIGGPEKKPLTLDQLAGRIEANPQISFDWQAGDSGCGCALDEGSP